MKKELWIKALVALALVWAVSWGISAFAGSKKASAKRFIAEYQKSALALSDELDSADRRRALNDLAQIMNRMDMKAREELREKGRDSEFFESLSPDELQYWIELTIEKSMTKMMQALDAMPTDERKRFIEKGIAELEKGRTKDDMERLKELDPDLIDRITEEGMTAYYQEAGSKTKMDLAPLMEAMNGVMQGIRGNPYGPPN